eukprot:CAMPEP_0172317382 /NCGR_PEP_ID=MMETSP1058-20130122/31412_1 /TAXON_ID=83371 /ORGANISM="Detonula confervacea, Strain CCMP 353" /LENGTH=41 /DNA_ID= /DNA_START= /DNA_END= /DNA_ORIENTATION=
MLRELSDVCDAALRDDAASTAGRWLQKHWAQDWSSGSGSDG